MDTARNNPADTDLYLDSAALNLHDVYSGFERIFRQIAATVDDNLPAGADWHRELLEQMGLDLPKIRPAVLTPDSIQHLDQYLRFRHVVRNIYTFSFDPERIAKLVTEMDAVFPQIRQELTVFASFLEKVGTD